MRNVLMILAVCTVLAPLAVSAQNDVQARLAAIEAGLHGQPAPQWLPAPFTDEEARVWVAHAAKAKRDAQQAVAQLQQIGAEAELPLTRGTVQQGAPYDRQDLGRLQRLAESTIRRIDEAVQETQAHLLARFEGQHRELDYYRNLDPANQHHRMNAFLKAGAVEDVFAEFDRQQAFTQSVAAWQRAFGQQPGESTLARLAEINSLRQRYADNRRDLIGDSRLPEAASTDEQRLSVAREILSNRAYGFGRFGPVVLTTPDIVDREREVSRAEIREFDVSLSGEVTLSGTQTTWAYRWQEFRFATPIQDADSGDWHVWWITARNYSSGWDKTPIGRWVSGTAVRGELIPEENFQ
jgi:hypothetical protein